MESEITTGSTHRRRQHVAAATSNDHLMILTNDITIALHCIEQFSTTNRTTVIIHFYCQFKVIKNSNDGCSLTYDNWTVAIKNVKTATHPDDLWLLEVPFSRWETVLLLNPSSYETATQSVGNPRQRNQASRRKKKRKKTHTSIPLIFHSTLFGMRLIKEGWFHLLAPGPEVTDRSSVVTDRSWLNHSHNNAAKGICLHPPEDLQRKGGGVDHTWLPPLIRTSRYSPPIWHVTVVLLGQLQYHTLTSAKIQLMRHLMFVFSKKVFNVSMRFNFDSAA